MYPQMITDTGEQQKTLTETKIAANEHITHFVWLLRSFNGSSRTRHWRRRRDSNPRYSFPYGTLAMCWFQPLTHSSVGIPDLNGVLSPEDEFYAISGIWQVVMGVNSFLQPDLDRYRPRPPASI